MYARGQIAERLSMGGRGYLAWLLQRARTQGSASSIEQATAAEHM